MKNDKNIIIKKLYKIVDNSIEVLLVALKSSNDEQFLKEINSQLLEYKNLQKYLKNECKKTKLNIKKTPSKTSSFKSVRSSAVYVYKWLCSSVIECIITLCDYDSHDEDLQNIAENLYCLQENNIIEIKKFFCKEYALPNCK